MNVSSNQMRIDQSFEEFFDFSNLTSLQLMDLNFGFNDIQPDFLSIMFKQISKAVNITTFSVNLESTRVNPVHFNRAAK